MYFNRGSQVRDDSVKRKMMLSSVHMRVDILVSVQALLISLVSARLITIARSPTPAGALARMGGSACVLEQPLPFGFFRFTFPLLFTRCACLCRGGWFLVGSNRECKICSVRSSFLFRCPPRDPSIQDDMGFAEAADGGSDDN